jgi:nucleotide-binding universal stress UspA family protein
MQFHKILVPTDFSKAAEHALERAVELAKLAQGEIHLMHAYELPTKVGAVDVPLAIPQEFFDQMRDTAQRYVDEGVKRASAQGVKVYGYLTCATPARAILDAADEIGADLIVMGTHGHTGIKHLLLGSVAERIVRLAHCPVMTVKSPGA